MGARIASIILALTMIILLFNIIRPVMDGAPDWATFVVAMIAICVCFPLAFYIVESVGENMKAVPEDPNRKKWLSSINVKSISEEQASIINHFLLIDNIDYHKYLENNKANQIFREFGRNFSSLTALSMNPEVSNLAKQGPNCTPTFKKFFAETDKYRAPGFPDWFYVAYPDVVIWLQNNLKKPKNGLQTPPMDTDEEKSAFFRYVIDLFKQQGQKLECAV